MKDFIQGKYDAALTRSVEFFIGEYSWFVPSFVVSNLVFNGICRMLPEKRNRLLMVSICLFAGILIKDIQLFDFWCIDAALVGTFYMVIGVLIADQIDYLKYLHLGWIAVGIGTYGTIVALCISLYDTLPRYDFHNVIYCNYFLCLMATLIGCILLVAVFCRIESETWLTRLWGMVGRNTLVIYLMHFLLKKYMVLVLNPLLPYNAEVLSSAVFYAILACIAGAIIGEVTREKIPILHGRYR